MWLRLSAVICFIIEKDKMNLPKAILFFLISLFLSQIVYYYPNLPEKVASHFDVFGEADGWMSKSSFLVFQLILLAFIALFSFALPVLLKKTPISLINLPNKEYWLAPERKERTFSILSRRFEWFGIALCALMISINQLVIQANLTDQNFSPASWYIVGAFLLFVVIWSIRLCKDFKIAK